MAADFLNYGLGFAAGVLSTLSPCVLPLIPIVIGSAARGSRSAPLMLAGGLAVSYAVLGTALAWATAQIGLDTSWFRYVGALIMTALGVVLLVSSLQQKLAFALSGVADGGSSLLARVSGDGQGSAFLIGLVLGIVWSPCVGPTLGTAIVLAGQGENLGSAFITMSLFGLGAAMPLVIIAYASRSLFNASRGKLMNAGARGKQIMGGVLVLIGFLILSGLDKPMETWLVDHSPSWLTTLTTSL